MATTSPNNISYPTNASTKKPIEGHIQDTADSVQTALNTKANLSGATFTGVVNTKGLTSSTTGGVSTFSVSDSDVSGQVELGRQDGVAANPYIDFHSGATATDYDVRIQASGGNGTSGKGTLFLTADRTSLAGRLNLPDQPAFSTSMTGGWITVSPNNVVVFNSPQFNIGSHYNSSNGRFTAPIAGRYVFSFNFYIDGQRQASFRKNGSDYIPSDTAIAMSATGTSTTSASYLFNLAAGDYVEIGCRSGSTSLYFYSGHSWFMGYMIG